MTDKPPRTDPPDHVSAPTPDPRKPAQNLVNFLTLTNGASEVTIEYQGQRYRLRATRNGKLILNK